MELMLGTLSLSHTCSSSSWSRISRAKMPGLMRFRWRMVCTTLGVATLGLDPPITAGLTLPVSLYLNAQYAHLSWAQPFILYILINSMRERIEKRCKSAWAILKISVASFKLKWHWRFFPVIYAIKCLNVLWRIYGYGYTYRVQICLTKIWDFFIFFWKKFFMQRSNQLYSNDHPAIRFFLGGSLEH